jgi:hypothetical protein
MLVVPGPWSARESIGVYIEVGTLSLAAVKGNVGLLPYLLRVNIYYLNLRLEHVGLF